MGEQLSDKQQVVGSSPTFCKTNNVSCIWAGSSAGSSSGLKIHVSAVQSRPGPPTGMHDAFLVSPRFPFQQSDRRLYNQNPIVKTGIRRSTSLVSFLWYFCHCVFHFMPPHKKYTARCGCRKRILFYISRNIQKQKLLYSREFLHLGSGEFVFYSAISKYLIWRGTQVA